MLYIYGAKSIALGICRALQVLYPENKVQGFLVTSADGNPMKLANLPVREVDKFVSSLTEQERNRLYVLIATTENVHSQIEEILQNLGITNYTCITSRIENDLMKRYFMNVGSFMLMHDKRLDIESDTICKEWSINPTLEVFVAKYYKDVKLSKEYFMPEWITPIQVGAKLTELRVAEVLDSEGEHISEKNVNYCELTALYWLWKNRLFSPTNGRKDYFGLFHYRRMLDVSDDDLVLLKKNDVDVILPIPMLHEPNAYEHHTRYINEGDWNAMLQALKELHPEYYAAMEDIFKKPYFYNYNMIIAKPEILARYCAWLFPVLERTEALSVPKGMERADRYIGYLGENLMTLFFMYHAKDLNIVHTGRLMLI